MNRMFSTMVCLVALATVGYAQPAPPPEGIQLVSDITFSCVRAISTLPGLLLVSVDHQLVVVDSSDPDKPQFLGASEPFAADVAWLSAIRPDLVLSDKGIFDVSDPRRPNLRVLRNWSNLPVAATSAGRLYTFDGNMVIINDLVGGQPVELGRYAPGKYLYQLWAINPDRLAIGLEYQGQSRLQLVDVSQPAAPTILGQVTIGSRLVGLVAQWPIVYALTVDRSAASDSLELAVIDASVPNAPRLVVKKALGTFDGDRVSPELGIPSSSPDNLIIQGSLLVAVHKSLGPLIIDIADPLQPELIAPGNPLLAGADVSRDGDRYYWRMSCTDTVAARLAEGELQPISSLEIPLRMPGSGELDNLVVDPPYAYATQWLVDDTRLRLLVIDVHQPERPQLVAQTDLPQFGPLDPDTIIGYRRLMSAAGRLFVLAGSKLADAVDVSDPSRPRLFATLSMSLARLPEIEIGSYGLQFRGAELQVVDLSSGEPFTVRATRTVTGELISAVAMESLVALGSRTSNVSPGAPRGWLTLLDLSVPLSPTLVSTTPFKEDLNWIFASRRATLLVSGRATNGDEVRYVVDVSHPGAPRVSLIWAVAPFPCWTTPIYSKGAYVYIKTACDGGAFRDVTVQDSTDPFRQRDLGYLDNGYVRAIQQYDRLTYYLFGEERNQSRLRIKRMPRLTSDDELDTPTPTPSGVGFTPTATPHVIVRPFPTLTPHPLATPAPTVTPERVMTSIVLPSLSR